MTQTIVPVLNLECTLSTCIIYSLESQNIPVEAILAYPRLIYVVRDFYLTETFAFIYAYTKPNYRLF